MRSTLNSVAHVIKNHKQKIAHDHIYGIPSFNIFYQQLIACDSPEHKLQLHEKVLTCTSYSLYAASGIDLSTHPMFAPEIAPVHQFPNELRSKFVNKKN